MVELPASCYNVYATIPGSSTSFSPVGVTDNVVGYLNNIATAGVGFNGTLVNGNGVTRADVLFLLIPGSGELSINLSSLVGSHYVRSMNVYADATGSFDNVSPLQYGNSIQGTGAATYVVPVPLSLPVQMDLVMHAVMCPSSVPN